METRGSLSGKAVWYWVPALFGMHDFANVSAKSANRMTVLTTIVSEAEFYQVAKPNWPDAHVLSRPQVSNDLHRKYERKVKVKDENKLSYNLVGEFPRETVDAVPALLIPLGRLTPQVVAHVLVFLILSGV